MENSSELPAQKISADPQQQDMRIATASISRNQWKQTITEWEKSELTQKAFCQSRRINFSSFSYYRTQFKIRQPRKQKLATIKVVSNKPTSQTSLGNFIVQSPSGTKLILPRKYNPSELKSLLVLLGVCSC